MDLNLNLMNRELELQLCLLPVWWRSIVVRTLILLGGLSQSCARLMDGCLTTLWVWRPISVNQQGQLSLPSFRVWLNE